MINYKHTYTCEGKEMSGLAECEQYARKKIESGEAKQIIVCKNGEPLEAFVNDNGNVKFLRLKKGESYE